MDLQSRREEIEKVQEEFTEVWTTILKDIKSEPKYNDIRSQIDWLEKVTKETVPRENQARAYLSMFLFRSLKPDRSPEDDFLNYVSGWMIQMTQAALDMLHDIISDSETRNGQLCWHQNPEVGLGSLNDAFMLECVAYNMAFKYFEGKDYLLNMVRMYRENGLCAGFGEQLALETGQNFSKFTEAAYKNMVKYKKGRFHFYIPMASALMRAGIQDQNSLGAVKQLAIKFGELFQLQDDFLDCYGDPVVTGKPGTDISDGKFTWLIVKALDLGSESQKEILRSNYGHGQAGAATISAANKVKNVYDDLELEDLFYMEEDVLKQEITKVIKELPKTVEQEPFLNLLDLMYRREK